MQEASNKMFNLQQPRRNTPTPRSPAQLFAGTSRLAESPGDEAWFDHGSNRRSKEVDAALSQFQKRVDVVAAQVHEPVLQVQLHQPLPSQECLEEETVQLHQPATPETQPADSNINNTATPELPVPAQVHPSTPAPPAPEPLSGVAELFTTPEQAIFCQPPVAPAKRGRRLKKQPVTVTSLRRSKRQACSRLKHLPAEERANQVLCKRLGYIKDDLTPAEQAIQEFVASFKGPMPQHIVAGLTAVFRLDDDDINRATNALLKFGGPDVVDGLPEMINGA
ncbi:unnamed protein product [Urochloa humidicola]